jgi:NACalpha-BTF3-like transcription factor
MSPNEFDRLLREKFDNEMVTFNPDQWKRLASALPKEKNRKLIYIKLGSIAAALVLLGFGFLYFNDSNNSIASVDKKEATPKASIIVSPDLKNDSPIKLNEPTAKTTISTPLKLDNLTSSTSIVKKNSTKSLHQNTISIKSLETQLAIQEPQVTHGFSETSEKFILSKHDDVVNSSNQKIKEQISNSALSKTIQIADKELEIEDVKLLASKTTVP